MCPYNLVKSLRVRPIRHIPSHSIGVLFVICLDLRIDLLHNILMIDENYWEIIFECTFEITITTIKDAIQCCFKKPSLLTMAVSYRSRGYGIARKFGEYPTWCIRVTHKCLIKNILVMINMNDIRVWKMLHNFLCQWIILCLLFNIQNH